MRASYVPSKRSYALTTSTEFRKMQPCSKGLSIPLAVLYGTIRRHIIS